MHNMLYMFSKTIDYLYKIYILFLLYMYCVCNIIYYIILCINLFQIIYVMYNNNILPTNKCLNFKFNAS